MEQATRVVLVELPEVFGIDLSITNEVVLLWLGAGLAIGLAALGTGISIGMLASRSVEAAARQREAIGHIQRLMILGIAFVEALCLYALLISYLLVKKGEGRDVHESENRPEVVQEQTAH